MIKNYHTHTYRCNHASGDAVDYAEAAVSRGVTVLGISDHTPLPDNRWLEMRMDINQLGGYLNAIEKASKNYPQLTILKGMECDYSKEYHSFFKDELLGKWGLNYLIASAHFYPYNGKWRGAYGGISTFKELKAYAEYLVETMRSGLFTFVAHPDLFGNSYELWDENTISCSRYILETAADTNIPLEINGYGLRKPHMQTKCEIRPMYPWNPFWELASQYNVSVLANSDAHKPEDIAANIEEAYSIAGKYGLKIADLSFLE